MATKPESNIPVWLIVLGFFFLPPVGVILLILKISGVVIPVGRAANQYQTRASGVRRTGTGSGAAAAVHTSGAAQKPPRQKKSSGGIPMIVFGSLITLGSLPNLIEELSMFGLSYPESWVPFLCMLCGGISLIGFGLARRRFARRLRLYQGAIGHQKSVYISDLANAVGISEKTVLSDLEKMLVDNLLPMGYIDRVAGRLVLTDSGYQPSPKQEAPKAPPKPKPESKPDPDEAVLREIRAVNDAIPGKEMSAKINRIEDVTRRILEYQRKNPDRAPQLRQFLNYYLPTTLRLLKTYADLDAQGVEGANISASKARIEGMMDKVVDGYEKQLDQLFSNDAMDIAADVDVLERMLEKDGLGSSGMTL